MNISASCQFSIIDINGVQISPTWKNGYCPILPHPARNAQLLPVSLYISYISLSNSNSLTLSPSVFLFLSVLYLFLTLSLSPSVYFYPTSLLSLPFSLSHSQSLFLHFSLVPLFHSHPHSLIFSLSCTHSLTFSLSHFLFSHFLAFYLSCSLSLYPRWRQHTKLPPAIACLWTKKEH